MFKPELTTEEKLARERAILQYVVDNIPYLIFWKDRNSVYLGCNKNFASLDQRSDPKDVVGRTDYDMVWSQHAAQYQAFDREVMDRGEPILNREETSPDEKGGEMVILTSKVPLRNEADEVVGILGMIVDITERKRMETELKRAKEAAEEAARAKSRFMANISHELRTPLTLILGPVKEALQDASLPKETRSLLERVQRNGFRLYHLVNDVLDFAKGESGRTAVRREQLDAAATVRSVLEDMRPVAQSRNLALDFSSSHERIPASLDPRLFERIVLNLVGNALKFTPSGGSVSVRTSLEGEQLRVDVADTGIGIAKAEQPRLFQPFAQVDSSLTRKHDGTGLGLALVKHFAEALGGTVGFESEEGRGSTFTVLVPTAMAAGAAAIDEAQSPMDAPLGSRAWQQQVAAPAASTSADEVRAGSGKRKILVADDNADMRAYVAESLARDFDVEQVENGRLAWERLTQERFDVVVSDVMMPELDGLGLTSKIKSDAALRRLPVILLTARGGTEATASGLDAGADDYLAKPFAAEELRARVGAALRMSRLQEDLRTKSRESGMASVAAGVLHNLGNVLNSVGVASAILEERVRGSKVKSLQKVAAIIEQQPDPAAFLSGDERGKQLPMLLRKLADQMVREQEASMSEIADLKQQLEHLKSIVSSHRGLARSITMEEMFEPGELTAEALRLISPDGSVRIEQRAGAVPMLRGDKHKVLQILINLMSNARHALQSSARADKHLVIATERQNGSVHFVVADNGIGISDDVKAKLFTQGFTTKPDGQGLGLHTSALLAQQLGGSLTCDSRGPGEGATFVLALPVA